MKESLFTIKYKDQSLAIAKKQDANNTGYYQVQFPGDRTIDLFITPELDGMPQSWAEGTGEKTELAKEIGELIEQHTA